MDAQPSMGIEELTVEKSVPQLEYMAHFSH